jgi:hypothetical protein
MKLRRIFVIFLVITALVTALGLAGLIFTGNLIRYDVMDDDSWYFETDSDVPQ